MTAKAPANVATSAKPKLATVTPTGKATGEELLEDEEVEERDEAPSLTDEGTVPSAKEAPHWAVTTEETLAAAEELVLATTVVSLDMRAWPQSVQ